MGSDYSVFYRESRWSRAKSKLKQVGKWAFGIVGGLLAVYVTAFVTGLIPPPGLARDLECRWQEWRSEPAPGTEFTILISNLVDDPDTRQTRLVRNVFLGQRGIDVRRTCQVIALDTTNSSLAAAETEAMARGKALLESRNADLLISGEVIEQNKALHLWFLGREDDTGVPGRFYSVTDKYQLPVDFTTDVAEQLGAIAFSQLEFSEQQALESKLEKLRPLLPETPDDPLRPQRTALLYSFGRAAAAFGSRELDREWLEEAILAYHRTSQTWTRERVPLAWAAVQQSLADALFWLGFVEADQRRYEGALRLFRESLKEWDREEVLPRSLAIRVRIGDTLRALGDFEQNSQRFDEASAAYREALASWSLGETDFDWATAQISLGDVLAQIGEERAVINNLKDAILAYEDALRFFTEYQWPREWANTQQKIGSVLVTNGKLANDPTFFRKAILIYQRVLRTLADDRHSLGWADTQLSLAEALFALGEWNHGLLRLKEGIDAGIIVIENSTYTGYEVINELNFTLKVIRLANDIDTLARIITFLQENERSQEEIPFFRWANPVALASANMEIGNLKGDPSPFRLAIKELHTAMGVLTPEQAPGFWALTQAVLGRALLYLAERQQDVARATEAVAAYRQALRILKREHVPLDWSQVRTGLAAALSLRGRLEGAPDQLRAALAMFEEVGPEPRGWPQDGNASYHFLLGQTWTRLGELQHSSVPLRKGIEAFEQALAKVSQPYQANSWARTQNWLGHATLALAERDPDAVPLASIEERVETLSAASRLFRKTGSDYYVAESEELRARAEALLAERRATEAVE